MNNYLFSEITSFYHFSRHFFAASRNIVASSGRHATSENIFCWPVHIDLDSGDKNECKFVLIIPQKLEILSVIIKSHWVR